MHPIETCPTGLCWPPIGGGAGVFFAPELLDLLSFQVRIKVGGMMRWTLLDLVALICSRCSRSSGVCSR